MSRRATYTPQEKIALQCNLSSILSALALEQKLTREMEKLREQAARGMGRAFDRRA